MAACWQSRTGSGSSVCGLLPVVTDIVSCTTFTPASLYDPYSYTMKPQELTHKPRARSRR